MVGRYPFSASSAVFLLRDGVDFVQRIRKNFEESAQLRLDVEDSLLQGIIRAAERLSLAILNNRKVIVFSDPSCASFSSYFVSKMTIGLEVDRPAFPAVELLPHVSSLLPLFRTGEYKDVFSKQLSIFSHPDDVLLLVVSGKNIDTFPELILTARDRELKLVVLMANSSLSPFLEETDISIDVSSASRIRVEEFHLFVLNCICDLLDCTLLGLEEL